MPARAAARPRNARTATSRAAKGKKAVLVPTLPSFDNDIYSNGSMTGPIILDDEEEDEMALRSPVKTNLVRTAATSKAASTTSTKGRAAGKAVFGASRDMNALSSEQRSSDPTQGEILKVSSLSSSSSSRDNPMSSGAKALRKGGKKAASISPAKAESGRPAALIDSSDDEIEAGSANRDVRRSAQGMSMPQDQIDTFLHNYDLEATNRIQRLRNHLAISLESARTQMTIALSRIPASARQLPLKDFIDFYGADVRRVLQGVTNKADATEKEGWEEMKQKRQRDREMDETGAQTKKPRNGKGTARSKAVSAPSPAKAKSSLTASTQTGSNDRAGGKSGLQASAPSSATFSPHIPALSRGNSSSSTSVLDAKTPAKNSTATAGRASRLAQVGELVQFMSLNGSPITGIIGPDGQITRFPLAGQRQPAADARDGDGSQSPLAAAESRLSSLAHGSTSKQVADQSPQGSEGLSGSRLPPSSPAPNRTATQMSSSSAAASLAASPMRGHTKADESDELPDEEAYMLRIMREEKARRDAASATTKLKTKPSFGRFLKGASGTASSSHLSGSSSRPPSSPGPQTSSFARPTTASAMRSSSPIKSSTATPSSRSQLPPLSGGTTDTRTASAASLSSAGTKGKRLSLVNARGETVDLANLKEADITADQRANLWKLFSRIGMMGGGSNAGGSPRKR